MSLPSLSITLDLHQNRLSGVLPAEIGQLTSLGTLDLGENMFSGVIPTSLGNCIGLERLYLEGNDFQGAISNYLQTLRGLIVLDLSRNNFSGNIPNFLVTRLTKINPVLLDDEMVAHVSDFGMARLLSKDAISSYANQSSSVGVRGTIGYTPPEYGLGNEVSTHGDVYSYGILLLEMFTGRRPTDGKWNKGKSLHEVVKEALSEQETEILDPLLLEDIVREETGSGLIMEAVISILSIALLCSADLPRERLYMSDVAARLSSIRNSLL